LAAELFYIMNWIILVLKRSMVHTYTRYWKRYFKLHFNINYY